MVIGLGAFGMFHNIIYKLRNFKFLINIVLIFLIMIVLSIFGDLFLTEEELSFDLSFLIKVILLVYAYYAFGTIQLLKNKLG